MAAEANGPDLVRIVALLGAAVVAVPIFKRLGLGSVLGYLAAGLVIGPFGLGLFSDPQAIIHVAELGVVMFLFIVGLEMEPSRLWGLRREIFGLGVLQVGTCSVLLSFAGVAMGFPLAVSFVAAAGFVLTSTAIVMQVLEERGDLSTPKGQRMLFKGEAQRPLGGLTWPDFDTILYHRVDKSKLWDHLIRVPLDGSPPSELAETGIISRIAVHPDRRQLVWESGSFGLELSVIQGLLRQ
jgi:hypothetical protein